MADIVPSFVPSGAVSFVPTFVAPVFPDFAVSEAVVAAPVVGRGAWPAFVGSASTVFVPIVLTRGELLARMLVPGSTSLFLRG